MDDVIALFPDVADALGIESVAIVEKDFYIVELLRLLQPLNFGSHQLVFCGGTALSKAGIALNRMSEDVDIKLVPVADFFAKNSRTQRKAIRKHIIAEITEIIAASAFFRFDEAQPKTIRDEYRYSELPIRYPQKYAQVPCLRPFIKLEIIEATLLEPPEKRDIQSLVTALTQQGVTVPGFPCATVLATQAEKLVSIMRRPAAHVRRPQREDDASLVRHVYDNFCIARTHEIDLARLQAYVRQCIKEDIERYGIQYPEFCTSPIAELRMGLKELAENPVHRQRYQQFVVPMVYGQSPASWEEAFARFQQTAIEVLSAAR
ncbi:nucleotidyl transferase AbiEii/AbiGii toxin family protein [Pantoea dispersa]|uniref:nucleotidyl transferase AbiEii/AbiGii toxin family protein n=1 Tax=Pantoea dispersa TaxID=59814 RepID=UPI002DBD5E02|nr:nucleotidyl transferase AbiEii/AbiGii toxin family protein [Pantoea dispersa]MEB5972733.1 nucleotidyl transferase AbiEii/AbiGii toxin family protein [Pantoea dispersa]